MLNGAGLDAPRMVQSFNLFRFLQLLPAMFFGFRRFDLMPIEGNYERNEFS